MKKTLLLLLTVFAAMGTVPVKAQTPALLPLLYNWDDNNIPPAFYGAYNDCWGYVDSIGREYAIIGSSEGTYFFDITVPTNPVMVDFEASKDTTLCIHRDYKTYKHYAYGVADEGNNSLQIFDLQYMPDSVVKVYDSNQFSRRCHNIFISDDKLFLASNTVGFNFNAMDVLSLANPANPTFLSTLSNPQFSHVHDVYVRNDTAYCSNGNPGLFVYDYTTPTNPVLIGSLTNYPQQGYNHSSWATPDGRTLVFADETHGKALKVLDVSNLSNMTINSFFQSNLLNVANPGSSNGSIPHNPFMVGDLCFVSYYHDGVQVYDISNKGNPVNVAYYDTYTQHNDYQGYQGCWGVYPYLPSGTIIASDFKNGMFLLDGSVLLSTPANQAAGNGAFAYYNAPGQSFSVSITSASGINQIAIGVFDMLGKKVAGLEKRIPAGNTQLSLASGPLPDGIYLVSVSGNGIEYTRKVMVSGHR